MPTDSKIPNDAKFECLQTGACSAARCAARKRRAV